MHMYVCIYATITSLNTNSLSTLSPSDWLTFPCGPVITLGLRAYPHMPLCRNYVLYLVDGTTIQYYSIQYNTIQRHTLAWLSCRDTSGVWKLSATIYWIAYWILFSLHFVESHTWQPQDHRGCGLTLSLLERPPIVMAYEHNQYSITLLYIVLTWWVDSDKLLRCQRR